MIDTDIGILNVPELEALVSLNIDLAERYQATADDPEAEPETRRTAVALAAWRRSRARYFQQECAETERVEAVNESDRCTGFDRGSRPAQTQDQPVGPGSPVPAAPRSDGPRTTEPPSNIKADTA